MQPQTQATGQLINTQPTPQGQPDPNVASLVPDPTQGANQAKANLGLVTTMQDHLMKYKASQNQPQKGTPQDNKQQPEQKTQYQTKEIDALRTEFEKKIEDMKKGITDEIKADIKTALADDNATE